MEKETLSRSPGSIWLEILIVILIVVLVLAIHSPKRQWERQEQHRELCRLQMENLDYAERFYHKTTERFNSRLDEVLAHAEAESVRVYPAGFKMDRLTREDSGIDSFLVSYFDPYNLFSHFNEAIGYRYVDPVTKDSVVLTIEILPLYRDIPCHIQQEDSTYRTVRGLPETQYTFAANGPISVEVSNRGEQVILLLVVTQGRLRGQQLLPEVVRVKASDYIYNYFSDDLSICPTTNSTYQTNVNIKVAIQADMHGSLESTPPDTSLADSRRLSSIAMFRFIKQADALARRDLNLNKTIDAVEDSLLTVAGDEFLNLQASLFREQGKTDLAAAVLDSLIEEDRLDEQSMQEWETIRDSLYVLMNRKRESTDFVKRVEEITNNRKNILAEKYLAEKLDMLRKDKAIDLSESSVITTIMDSLHYYSNPDYIKERLFRFHTDSITTAYLAKPDVAGLFSLFSVEEHYGVGRVDSVGVTIACPIEGVFKKPDPSILEMIFAVRGERNHGAVENGDLSWSERR